MSAGPQEGAAEADGARLRFRRQGSGPALLMIPGGGGDGARYARIAAILSAYYTVLTYDRRGNAGSRTPGSAPAVMSLDQQSTDAKAVIEANGFASALVFGNSGGATIGLEMAARIPGSLDGLVAHEPPLPNVLPDAAEHRSDGDALSLTLQRDGWRPAAIQFLAMNGLLPGNPLTRAALRLSLSLKAGPAADLAHFVTCEMMQFLRYAPDFGRIASSGVPIVFAAGRTSAGSYCYEAARACSERLGTPFAEFPGGHTGFAEDPQGFAAALREALRC